MEKERRRKEGQLSLEQEKVKKTEGKMFDVKTNKEYQALLTEIDSLKGANSREEEEILQLLDEIDEVKKSLSKREKEIACHPDQDRGREEGASGEDGPRRRGPEETDKPERNCHQATRIDPFQTL